VTTPRNVDSLTYEEARDELISIVAKLEAGAATLDESLALWERGEALAVRCQQLLEGARARVMELKGDETEANGDDTPKDDG
jgi:exodeoxyribonuclease VII small subunit